MCKTKHNLSNVQERNEDLSWWKHVVRFVWYKQQLRLYCYKR